MTRRAELVDVQAAPCTNLSLWLDRFPNELNQEDLREHQQIALNSVEVPEGYKSAFETRKQSLEHLDGGFAGGLTRFYRLQLAGRAVIGIGAASVRETSLSLLRPWGLPYIPGSALKGLVSHLAHDAGGEWAKPAKPGDPAGAQHRSLFGDLSCAGAVTFHDGWWEPGQSFPVVADTVTVHHSEYYRGESPPLDSDEPNPVGFLSTTGSYQVALSGPSEALDVVAALLKQALEERGIGAKTSAGYGRGTVQEARSEVAKRLTEYHRAAVRLNDIADRTRELLALIDLARSGDERDAAGDAAARMVAQSPDVFRKWLEDPKRTDLEREWFGRALPSKPPPNPVAVTQPENSPAEVTWQAATAYAQKDAKNRFQVHVSGMSAIDEGKLSKGRPSEELKQRLLEAEARPIDVEILVEGKKLKGIREKS